MSEVVDVMAIVEGPSEKIFIERIVAPHLVGQNIFLRPVVISKSGQKGGDVKFERAINDIEKHLKQRRDSYVTLFIDYYGTKPGWPGMDLSENERRVLSPAEKAERVRASTLAEVERLFPDTLAGRRFIPYIAMYEFEALLFSDPTRLAERLDVPLSCVQDILDECGEPERINDSPLTAPAKRLARLNSRFKKTSTGISIAEATGLPVIRSRCPIFNDWVRRLESLGG